jgi:hypothetical protein
MQAQKGKAGKTIEAIRQIVKVSKDHEIKIKIPQYIPENEIAEVILIIRKKPDSFKQKINELKEAMGDNLFLDDLKEISEDFKAVDLSNKDS